MSVHSFDFGELFTLSARPVIASAVQRGLAFYFDYGSPPNRVAGDAQAFRRGIYRVLSAASQVLDAGALILAGEIAPGPAPGTVAVRVDAAASGVRCDDAGIDTLLAELELVRDPVDPALPDVVTARGTCPVLGGDVLYRCVPSAGVLFSLLLTCEGEVRDELRTPDAHGCSALILHGGDQSAHGLSRRLQGFGWHVRQFDSVEAFAEAVVSDSCAHRLAIAIASEGVDVDTLVQLTTLAGPAPLGSVDLIHAVRAGSPVLGTPAPPGWDFRVVPFLPSEIWDFTRRADPDAPGVPQESRPTPLESSPRPRVLVVDDDEVNRIIASGLLQMIGYDTLSASSGDEAIAMCRRVSPDAVLMDINMPGLDGYEATAVLKRLQKAGGIPPFPIIAATAAGTQARSMAGGLDGHLSKPLLADDLRLQLHRALKGLATGL